MEDQKGIQIIRAFKKNGITTVYNYTGDSLTGIPVKEVETIYINNNLRRVVDKKKKSKH